MRGGGGGGFRGGGGGGGMVRGGWGGGGGGMPAADGAEASFVAAVGVAAFAADGVVAWFAADGAVFAAASAAVSSGVAGLLSASALAAGPGGAGGWGGGWGGWGGWGPSYVSDIGWDPGYYGGDPGYYGGGYPASYSAGYPQQSSPNVTVVYPPQAPASNTVVLDRSGGSVTREYDQYGQEINRQLRLQSPIPVRRFSSSRFAIIQSVPPRHIGLRAPCFITSPWSTNKNQLRSTRWTATCA